MSATHRVIILSEAFNYERSYVEFNINNNQTLDSQFNIDKFIDIYPIEVIKHFVKYYETEYDSWYKLTDCDDASLSDFLYHYFDTEWYVTNSTIFTKIIPAPSFTEPFGKKWIMQIYIIPLNSNFETIIL